MSGTSLRGLPASEQPGPLLSVVVNNFNYARFLPQCINSALNQTYPRTEVVVVDDASTDTSAEIIRSFGDRIVPVLQPVNGGQAAAMNAGFAACSGDFIIFLDADDFLYSGAATAVIGAFTDAVALVQYRLHLVDVEGNPIDLHPPADIRFDVGDVTEKLVRLGRFEGNVTSGLAFSRAALTAVTPIPPDRYRIAADGYLATTVPFHGEVRAIDEPLGAYRKHGGSLWSTTMNAAAGFRRSLLHDAEKYADLKLCAARRGMVVVDDPGLNDYQHLSVRIGSLLLDDEQHPAPRDSRVHLAGCGFIASLRAPLPMSIRLVMATWYATMGLLPAQWARTVFLWRTAPSSRPALLRNAIRLLRGRTGT